jgi:hypothetical protein
VHQSSRRDHRNDSRPQRHRVIDQDDVGALSRGERAAIGETRGAGRCRRGRESLRWLRRGDWCI